MKIRKEPFGIAPDGQPVHLYTLTNSSGTVVKITNYGAIVTSILTPDKNGNLGDVVLGFNSVDGYVPNEPHIGGIIGRYANRIAQGKFTLEGQEYTLAQNDGPNHLHGGHTGFDRVVWQVEELPEQQALKLTYLSRDGEEGYPGNVSISVTYSLTEDNSLQIDYEATTDKPTPVNLTNHSYFNLSTGQQQDISDHILSISTSKYVVTNESLIPTGELAFVNDTPYDFRTPRLLGTHLYDVEGYDLNYVIDNGGTGTILAASVQEPVTGRTMDVYTTQPGIQLYTAYHLDGSLTGKDGHKYNRYAGLCLETQHFPDSPNHRNFPDSILRPGETYRQTTSYKFGVKL